MRPCIDENEAAMLLRRPLDEAASDALDAHVDDCEHCLVLLSSLASVEARDREPDEPGIRLGRGASLGRYVLLELLGVGSMGVVYAAYDPELDRKVALKILVSDAYEQAAQVGHVKNEARAMARLRHPNVVAVFELGSFESGVFLAMELAGGTTLTEWLRRQKRRPEQIVAAFVEAGRGLDAAHRVGVIHRDFKPDNVLVDEPVDGPRRIAVTDFGLATRHGAEPGIIAGTPRYMAPEQRAGGHDTDARADQYSFCVALQEALIALGPEGELAGGRRRMPGVRPTITRALVRGLAEDPRHRWPTMAALLAELAPPRQTRWHSFAIVVTSTISVALIVWVLFRSRIEQKVDCDRRTRAIDELWSAVEKDAVRRGILGTATSFAPDEWSRVERILDPYVARAHGASVELCRARPSRDDFALRAACLDDRVDQLREVMTRFVHADAATVRSATSSAYQLGRIDECSDIPLLLRGLPSRPDPATLHALVLARSLATTGNPREAEKVTEEAMNRAEARGDARSVAAAMVYWANLAAGMGDGRAAEERGVRAERLAETVGADSTRARALVSLMSGAGIRGDLPRTLELDDRAKLVLQRIGGDDSIEALRLGSLGVAYVEAGNFEAGSSVLVQTVDLQRRLFGPKAPEVALGLANLGNAALELGDLRTAREAITEAITIWTEAYGARFAKLSISLTNLGRVDVEEGHLEAAAANYRRALGIAEAAGSNHWMVALVLSSVGDLELRRGRASDALPILERALSIQERVHGKNSHPTRDVVELMGLAHFASGDRHRAVALLSHAATLGEGGSRPQHARAKFALARALAEEAPSNLERSMALAVEALASFEKERRRDLEAENEVAAWIRKHEKRASR